MLLLNGCGLSCYFVDIAKIGDMRHFSGKNKNPKTADHMLSSGIGAY